MHRSIMAVAAAVAVLITVVFVVAVPAQQQAPLQTELLAEVRLLRQSIEALAGTNARVQIVFGRLQLQEQRTSRAEDRLAAARQSLVESSSNASMMAEQIKAMEAKVDTARLPPDQLEQLRVQVNMLKRESERSENERARMVADEADAAAALNLEQGRWSDLNRQLEELERALAAKPR